MTDTHGNNGSATAPDDGASEVRTLVAKRVSGVITTHGEGPVWSQRRQCLHLVDLLAGAIVRLDPHNGHSNRLSVGAIAAAFRPRADGGLVVAVERGFALIDPDGEQHQLGTLWSDTGVRMNDGGTDPDGRFYCGSMGYDAAPGRGAFWRLNPDLTTDRLWSDVTVSNGFAFSPDSRQAYYIDTPTGRVDVLDYVDGNLLNRRTAVAEAGHPDGMTVDVDGNLWVAQFGGSAVLHFSPAGDLLTRVEVGARQVTACTFGGSDMSTLYITTSREGLAAGDDPAAGAVFAVVPGTSGMPALEFAR